jgi:DNA-binding SARP family transcriptional activator
MSVLSVTLFHVRPWHPLTMPSYLRMEELLQVSDDPAVALLGVMATLVVSGLCGDFDRGDRMAYLVEPLALRAEASPSDVAWTYAQIGWLRFAEARYDEALAVLRKAYEIAQRNGLKRVAVQSLLWRYTIEWRMGDWPAALAALAEAETSETARPPMAEAQLRLFQARAARHRGEPREASRLACLSQDAAMRVGSRVQELVFCVSNADVQLDAARIDLARPLIATARALIERAPLHRYHWPSVLLLEARCLIEDGDLQAGLQRLREALTAALEANHRFYLRVCDWSMPGLFVQALKHRIEPQLVVSLIRMFRLRPPSDATDDWPWPVRVLTLGCFSVHVDGQPLEFSRKLPRKTLLLLKAIVAHGGREVSEQVLCDALWADEDGDAARNALSITLLRLRKLLKHPEAVVQQGGRIWLNRQCCWVDAWSFLAKRLGDPEGASEALSLYRGTFLPGDEPEVWSVPLRERLRARFVELLLAQGGALEESGDQSGALQCYARGIETDAIVEAFYAGAMRCYERLGRRTEAFSVYRRLRQTLSVILGVEPSEATQRLFAEMVRRQNSSAA